MTEATWKNVRAAAKGVDHAVISGYGEALTSSETLRRLRELDADEVDMGFCTNGTALTPAICSELAALRHLVNINVSIDSPDAETYRAIRGGELHRALKGIENLMGALSDPNKVTVSCVLMGESLQSLIAFPEILQKLGVRWWGLQSHYDHAPGSDFENLGEHASEHLTSISEAASKAGVSVFYANPDRAAFELRDPVGARREFHYDPTETSKALTRRCVVPWYTAYVDKDARVFPCCHSSVDLSAQVGDLNEAPLEEIWTGEEFRKFRSDLLVGSTMRQICANCDLAPLVDCHPYHEFSAAIVPELSVFRFTPQVRVVARNTGAATWTRDTPVRVGTAKPRDRHSDLYHATWLSPNRAAHFAETEVPPGQLASFCFQVDLNGPRHEEFFELVVDGRTWLPLTCFKVGGDCL